jgi:hypothetical protein
MDCAANAAFARAWQSPVICPAGEHGGSSDDGPPWNLGFRQGLEAGRHPRQNARLIMLPQAIITTSPTVPPATAARVRNLDGSVGLT